MRVNCCRGIIQARPSLGRLDDVPDPDEEIGLEMWEKRGDNVLEAPWFHDSQHT